MSPNHSFAHNNKGNALPNRILNPYFVSPSLVSDLQVTFFMQEILLAFSEGSALQAVLHVRALQMF